MRYNNSYQYLSAEPVFSPIAVYFHISSINIINQLAIFLRCVAIISLLHNSYFVLWHSSYFALLHSSYFVVA